MDFFWCLRNKERKQIPFSLRAQVLNSFRRQAKNKQPLQIPNLPKKKAKRKKREKPEVQAGPGSLKNYFKCSCDWLVKRLTSAGRNRPSRKVKYQFKRKSFVVRLKGNKDQWR